jgi:hypothetical protein
MAAYVQFNRPGPHGMSLDYGPFTHVFVTRGTLYGHCTVRQQVLLGYQTDSRDWCNAKDRQVYTDVVIYTKE